MLRRAWAGWPSGGPALDLGRVLILLVGNRTPTTPNPTQPPPHPPGRIPQDAARGAVAPSVTSALAALRAAVRAAPALRLRVLVTGSLYLVGDTLRALECPPK